MLPSAMYQQFSKNTNPKFTKLSSCGSKCSVLSIANCWLIEEIVFQKVSSDLSESSFLFTLMLIFCVSISSMHEIRFVASYCCDPLQWGTNYILKRFFVQSILADQYIHRRGL